MAMTSELGISDSTNKVQAVQLPRRVRIVAKMMHAAERTLTANDSEICGRESLPPLDGK